MVQLSRLMTLMLVATVLAVALVAGADARPPLAMLSPMTQQSIERTHTKSLDVLFPSAKAFAFETVGR
jgi:hypothetical protein